MLYSSSYFTHRIRWADYRNNTQIDHLFSGEISGCNPHIGDAGVCQEVRGCRAAARGSGRASRDQVV